MPSVSTSGSYPSLLFAFSIESLHPFRMYKKFCRETGGHL